MTQAFPRTNFNSSRLVRLLEDWAPVDGVESKPALAQRLGQWVSFTDAVTLYSALDGSAAQAAVKPLTTNGGPKPAAHHAATEEWVRVRAAMVDVINKSCSTTLGSARIKFPAPQSDTPLEMAVMYSPFHRFYLALQREMEAKVGPLRATVRAALTTASPALKQLAALDTALDGILNDRERRLLSTIPVLLQRRFEQLLTAHQQTLVSASQADDSTQWMQPGAWLANFRDELRGVLLAEWDVRLQPAMGLVEALSNEVNGST